MSSVTQSSPVQRRSNNFQNKDCTPTEWSKYFDNQQDIVVKSNSFRLYSTNKPGKLSLFLLHGGGYSALTWSLFAKDITNKIDCQAFAMDMRGHGSTKTEDDEDLSLQVLVKDVVETIGVLFENLNTPIVLVGHSLGGSVAVAAASIIPNVVGLCMIDVVEGTALEALSSMQNVLRERPSTFKSVEQAIQWSLKHGETRNLEAARVSMPGKIKNTTTQQLATDEYDTVTNYNKDGASNAPESNLCTVPKPASVSFANTEYKWRIDLRKTERFWNGWFLGLSQKFLDVQVPKVLLLSHIQRLDTTLTVGQMQGKFQLQVLPRTGHAMHEDQPHRVADIVAGFLVKQNITVPINGFVPGLFVC